MTTEMLPIQGVRGIFADLLEIQQKNAPKPQGVKVNMHRHRKAIARSGMVRHTQKNTKNQPPVRRQKKVAAPKKRY
jgi:hypothetical protein